MKMTCEKLLGRLLKNTPEGCVSLVLSKAQKLMSRYLNKYTHMHCQIELNYYTDENNETSLKHHLIFLIPSRFLVDETRNVDA